VFDISTKPSNDRCSWRTICGWRVLRTRFDLIRSQLN